MLDIRFTDHMRTEADTDVISRPFGCRDHLLLYFPSPMKIEIDGKLTVSKNGACILFEPWYAHRFMGAPCFINSFVHFEDDGTLASFDFPKNKIFYPKRGEKVNFLIKEVKKYAVSHEKNANFMAHLRLSEIFVLLSKEEQMPKGAELKESFEQLRMQIITEYERDFSADDCAKQLLMSRSRFFYHYKRFFGTTPKQDALRARMEAAAMLLADNDKTVYEIAQSVGFESIEHFTRYYKKYFSKSPRRNIDTKSQVDKDN